MNRASLDCKAISSDLTCHGGPLEKRDKDKRYLKRDQNFSKFDEIANKTQAKGTQRKSTNTDHNQTAENQ